MHCTVGKNLFKAIQFLERCAIVHGDIKPANIVLRNKPRCVVCSVYAECVV
jgi:serine/threonine protein kinase